MESKKDEIIAELLRRFNYDKEPRNQLEVLYCSYCPEWEVLYKEDDPLKHLNICGKCHKLACEKCARINEWLWREELEGYKDPPYYTEYFCPTCQ